MNDNVRAKNLAELGSVSVKNRDVKCLLRVIDVFTKYAWVKPLNHKEASTVFNDFVKIVNKSKSKPNILLIKKKIYNNPMKKWLDDNDILTYATHNEDKSIVAERLIRTLKGKIY